MLQPETLPLRHHVEGPQAAGRFFRGASGCVALADLAGGTSLARRLNELAGRSVLLATHDQLAAALALIELDGVARRVVLCPPDVAAGHLAEIAANAKVDAIVSDRDATDFAALGVPLLIRAGAAIVERAAPPAGGRRTAWLLLTSGTTGAPKLVRHDVGSLAAPIKPGAQAPVWGTFYDIRRYGGLQIFFRAVVGGGSLILSGAGEAVADHLQRLATHGVTHLSGTPSHWRRALMSPAVRTISPRYVRLSGEIADQAILDNLRFVFPQAGVGHAYASTEAGVGFEVNDGRAGFPASLIGRLPSGVDMKVEHDTLRIRSSRTALRYVGGAAALADRDGFVDTGDIVALRDGRYFFVGRSNGVINVGGLKVHPEEVEAVINRHPRVRMSLVRARRNPITGALVVADVVLREEAGHDGDGDVEGEILRLCRAGLTAHKVPTAIRFVPALAVAATGKLARHHA